MLKGIARKGDKEKNHCSRPKRHGCFRSVFSNGIPVSGHGHKNTKHLFPPKICPPPNTCCVHRKPLRATQFKVFAERRLVGRVGDPTCTKVEQGSRNVFVGNA